MYHPLLGSKICLLCCFEKPKKTCRAVLHSCFVCTFDMSSCLAKAGVFGCSPGAQRALQGSEGCRRVAMCGMSNAALSARLC